MGLFDKKYCDICGEKIGLLGNKKLADGNMCKNCEKQLSPWFSERKQSTLDEIKGQMAYREENKEAVRAFHTTRSLGENMKLLIDEDAKKFMVTNAGNLESANPDVLDFSQVTGCRLDVDEDKDEQYKEDSQGNRESYNPPRYHYSYDFYMKIDVNHPYFNEISFKLNRSSVKTGEHSAYEGSSNTVQGGSGLGGVILNAVNAAVNSGNGSSNYRNAEFQQYMDMGEEIKSILLQARQEVREQVQKKNAPRKTIVCPYCAATTTPDASGCCEYCGASLEV